MMRRVSATPAPPPTEALDRIPPVPLVLTGIFSVQFGAALAATIFDEVGASGTTLLRLGMAALVAAVVFRPDLRGRSAADLRLGVLFGLTLGVMNVAFYEALDRIPLGIAVTIEFAGPLGVAVALSRRRLDYVWAALAAAGIVLLADPGGGSLDPVGLALILLAAACWAAYILISQRAGRVFPGRSGIGMALIVAALVPIGPGIAQGGAELLEPRLLLIGLLVGVASSVIPYTLETEALRRMPAHAFGVLMSLEPAVAALAGLLILDQALGARELLAMACVVAASIGVTRAAPPGVPSPVDP
jgi:inner membrane transporter RhtA